MIRESLLNKKLWIFDSQINIESNHFKKDSNQLSLSVSPQNSNEIWIICARQPAQTELFQNKASQPTFP